MQSRFCEMEVFGKTGPLRLFSQWRSGIYCLGLSFSLPLIGMILTIYYNIKYRNKTGYETYLNRVIKIIWGVFNLSWIYIIALSFTLKSFHPVPPILFLLGMMLMITGLIIKFKPRTRFM